MQTKSAEAVQSLAVMAQVEGSHIAAFWALITVLGALHGRGREVLDASVALSAQIGVTLF